MRTSLATLHLVCALGGEPEPPVCGRPSLHITYLLKILDHARQLDLDVFIPITSAASCTCTEAEGSPLVTATSHAARKNRWRFSSDSFAIISTALLPVV